MASPWGEGILFTIVSSNSFTPSPVLPETIGILSVSKPIKSSICNLTFSGSEAGKSTLFNIGIISKFDSTASHVFARVCASTPWLASTNNKTPSQAANDLDTS